MTFKENSKEYFVLYRGTIAFSAVEFSILENLHYDDKKIIDDFIKYPEDFITARKYLGGYSCNHTDNNGHSKIMKNYDFGPYPIELLELNDYTPISLENFKEIVFKMFSEYYESNSENEFLDFINNIKRLLEKIDNNSTKLYQLNPSKWKYNELSPFQLSSYLCGFSINRRDKTITVIQIDDD